MTSASKHVSDVDFEIGRRIHTLLWDQRRRQTSLALALGLTPSVLSKKLRGESAWSARQVAIAASELGVSVGDLYGDSANLDMSLYFHGNESSHTRPTTPRRNTHPGHRKRRDVA
jgi:hypothetical protein